MAVEFTDYSYKIKAAMNDVSLAWLTETGNEVASKANDNTKLDGEAGAQLHGSYRATRRYKDHVNVGSPLEQAMWEEWGTGEHAVRSPHRTGWWVYKDGYEGGGGEVLTEEEAKAIAADDPTVHATDGRDPNYTLEKAFKVTMPKQEAELQRRLKERFGE